MNLEQLRTVQKAATPGPWERSSYGGYVVCPKEEISVAMLVHRQHINGNFMACFNPEMVGRLLDFVEAFDTWLPYPADYGEKWPFNNSAWKLVDDARKALEEA